mmetsp:Transcript_21348/g.47237  ORF Transcript_21348/g.47237 Transcript_21348/m.47237 type:complete len:426 (-) Transcript_21348:142-1419(-)
MAPYSGSARWQKGDYLSFVAFQQGAATITVSPEDGASGLRSAVEEVLKHKAALGVVFLRVGLGSCKDPPEDLVASLSQIAQPVVGIADGRFGAIGTILLAACDMIIATRSAEFRLDNDPSSLLAQAVAKVGLLTRVVDNAIELQQECEALRMNSLAGLHWNAMGSPSVPKLAGDGSGDARAMPQEVWPQDSAALLCDLDAESRSPTSNGQKVRGTKSGSKKKDLLTQYSTHTGPITSLMICNIPCRVTQPQLAQVVDSLGFENQYNFLYLPSGSRSSAGSSNLGYGFINFADPENAEKFKRAFINYRFDGTSSQKVCRVRPAYIQGLENNLQHFGRNGSRNRVNTQQHASLHEMDKGPVIKASLPRAGNEAIDSPHSMPTLYNPIEASNSMADTAAMPFQGEGFGTPGGGPWYVYSNRVEPRSMG